jgi:two-component system response regulator ArlR
MRLLLAEDERSLSRALVKILEHANYSVDAVFDGEAALDYLENGNYDGAILDIMMPKMDGIAVLQKIRAERIQLPVLLLTAKSEIDDKVTGLDAGANDYLTKPFAPEELLARIRAMLRTQASAPIADNALSMGNIRLNLANYELSSPYGSFQLANKEFQMMEMLLRRQKSLIPTELFLEKIWGYDSEAEVNVVWVYISYLRKKLNALHADIQIKATRNAGYSLVLKES